MLPGHLGGRRPRTPAPGRSPLRLAARGAREPLHPRRICSPTAATDGYVGHRMNDHSPELRVVEPRRRARAVPAGSARGRSSCRVGDPQAWYQRLRRPGGTIRGTRSRRSSATSAACRPTTNDPRRCAPCSDGFLAKSIPRTAPAAAPTPTSERCASGSATTCGSIWPSMARAGRPHRVPLPQQARGRRRGPWVVRVPEAGVGTVRPARDATRACALGDAVGSDAGGGRDEARAAARVMAGEDIPAASPSPAWGGWWCWPTRRPPARGG